MATIAQTVKAALSALETARKAFNACDEDCTELTAVQATLDAKRDELAEVEMLLAQAREETTRVGAALHHEQERLAAAQTKADDQIGAAQEELRQCQDQRAQAKNDNLLAGFRALKERLGSE